MDVRLLLGAIRTVCSFMRCDIRRDRVIRRMERPKKYSMPCEVGENEGGNTRERERGRSTEDLPR